MNRSTHTTPLPQPPEPVALRASGLADPIGVPDRSPVLSWALRGGQAPSRLRLQIADTPQGPAALFDGELASDTHVVPWPIAPLESRRRVWWRVGAALDGGTFRWSEEAFIEAALWSAGEWEAAAITHRSWLDPASDQPGSMPEVATDFVVGAPVAHARLYLSGAGIVVPYINGVQAIDGELEPGYSALHRSVPASAWDVTHTIRPGHNDLRVALGGGAAWVPYLTGRYTKFTAGHPPYARIRLEITFEDGRRQAVVSGGDWRARLGRTTVAHWFGGEDADSAAVGPWSPAVPVGTTGQEIWWRACPPIRVTERYAPKSVSRAADGGRIVDFGVNMAGRPTLDLRAAVPGRAIVLRPGELLTTDGLPDQVTTGGPIWDSLVPGAAAERWHPSFTYHGARYWHVSGLSEQEPDTAVGFEVMRTDNTRVGSFSTSDAFLDRLHRLIDRAVQSNMYSVITDCPHREKLGWLEQLHLCFPTLARNYDVRAHLGDAVRHMIEAQTADGLVPNIAPEFVVFDFDVEKGDSTAFRDDPNWGRAIIEVPWNLYEHYADVSALRRALPAAERYLDYLDGRAGEDGLLDFGLGDWIELDKSTPRALVATHGWATSLATAARGAQVLGEYELAEDWRRRSGEVWERFREAFRSASGVWGSGSQASWALAWTAGGVLPAERELIIQGLLASIDRVGGSITVGEIALPSLIRALTDSGHAEVLNTMIRRTDAAGYGFQLASEATSLTEMWAGPAAGAAYGSQNHFMLGVIDDWILGDVAGLRQAPGSVGWAEIVVRPLFLAGVDDASVSFDSPRGTIRAGWRRTAAGVELDVHVPPTVRVRVEAAHGTKVDVRTA